MNDAVDEMDDEWDLSGLLETVELPADGFARLRMRLRRRRWATRTVTVAVAAGLLAVVGLIVPGAGGAQRVVVAGPPTSLREHYSKALPGVRTGQPGHSSPTTAVPTTAPPTTAPPAPTTQSPPSSVTPTAETGSPSGPAGPTGPAPPVIAPAPASAAPGSKPFDVDGLRFWLPPSWYDSGGFVCVGVDGYELTLSPEPCSQTANRITVGLLPAYPGLEARGTQATVVNGLTALTFVTTPGSIEEYVPSLLTTFTATGPGAQAVTATLQPSPAADVIEAPNTRTPTLPSTVPAGWRHVVFDGLTLAVPPSWPVHDPSNEVCGGVTVGAVDLGQPPIVASCPAPFLGAPTGGPSDGVLVEDNTDPGAGPGAPVLAQATTTGGAQVELSADSLRQPMVEADVTAAGTSYTVSLDVGKDPSIAWDILGSIAPTASTADTPSTGS